MRIRRRHAALAVLLGLVVAFVPAPVAARTPVTYRPPVDGPVVDPFRPPSTPYGSGNRGVDYRTEPGQPVAAAAAGEVVFAGQVGGSLHIVVLHADGLRTSYSFLSGIDVARGQRVAAGATVGRAGSSLHFGVRAGDAYLDPMALFGGPPRVYLVPDDMRRSQSEAQERSFVQGMFHLASVGGRAVAGVTAGAVRWAAAGGEALGTGTMATVGQVRAFVDSLGAITTPGDVFVATLWAATRALIVRRPCTPRSEKPRSPPPRRRILVEVGGLGSSGSMDGRRPRVGHVSDVDENALGYDEGDVHGFSYRRDTVADRPYEPADTIGSIPDAGDRLYDLVSHLSAENPGVPIDVIAHSQGGMVARSMLAYRYNPAAPNAPRLGHVITLGSPHHGADLATVLSMTRHTTKGALARRALSKLRPGSLDPRAPAIRELSETSDFVERINERPMPSAVKVTSIAARDDVVVPSPRSHLRGATNAIVSVPGLNDHSNLPGSPAAEREMQLALAGQPPTCESWADQVRDAFDGHAISAAEDGAGLVGTAAGFP